MEESKNAYYKAFADTENTKRRLQNEFEKSNKYKLQDFGIEIDDDSVTLSDYQMRNRRAFINSGSDPDFEGLSE